MTDTEILDYLQTDLNNCGANKDVQFGNVWFTWYGGRFKAEKNLRALLVQAIEQDKAYTAARVLKALSARR